ncbi:MAG: redoxin domain-containing protein [Planctomycetes bacterium]|nr:redoxin domain-containing protein [Planctomycetota bacterium]
MALLGALAFAPAMAQQGGGMGGQQDQQRGGQFGQDQQRGGGQFGQDQQRGGFGQQQQVRVGQDAPEFELKDLDGNTHKLQDLEGEVIVLEWIDPTDPQWMQKHRDGGQLRQLYDRYEDQDVKWLGVLSFGKQEQGRFGQQGGVGQPGQHGQQGGIGQQGQHGQQGGVGGQQGGVGGQQGGIGQQGQHGQQGGLGQQQHGQTGQDIMRMQRDQVIQYAERAKEQLDLEFPILLDDGARIAQKFGVQDTPYVVIIDKEGKVAYTGQLMDQQGQLVGLQRFNQALNQAIEGEGTLPAGAPRDGMQQQQQPQRR